MDKRMVEIIQNSVGGCAKNWAELIAKALHNIGYRLQGETAEMFAERVKEAIVNMKWARDDTHIKLVTQEACLIAVDEICKEFTGGDE